MERLQNLKCLDTHFWAVELIVWVVFLVLFNTVSDRQSAVVHVVYCFYDVCRTYYQRSDRIFKRFYHWHTLSLCKYDAQAANNGIAQSSVTLFAERCGYAVVPLVCSILLVLISNFMNPDEEVIKLRNTQ